MSDLLTRLLQLDTLRLGAEGVELGFQRPIPGWAWVGIIAASIAVAAWSYSRLAGPAAARASLAGLRAMLIILLVFLISGPQLVQRDESVERDWVIVLADRSASMTIADAPADRGDPRSRPTREEQLRSAIADHWPMWSALARDRVVQWLGFDAGAFDLAVPAQGAPLDLDRMLARPAGQRTSIGAALDQALARAAARPLAAAVILSDGRSISEPSRAAIRRLQAERVPVHIVPLGSEHAVADLAVRRVDAPRVAFVNDGTPVRVEVERLGAADDSPAAAVVRLVDKATGLTLDERRILVEGASKSLTLTTRPDAAGARSWTVEIVPEGPDLAAGNNRAEFAIELVDRPMRVLYVDGYPRWEQRYLRNLLIREQSITCSTLILSPERRYIQEGDLEIDALPDSPEQWAEYDAVILGDTSPDVFSHEQLVQLREHISRRGGGLLWIAGASSTPVSWFDTPLGDLIPFFKDATDGRPIGEPVTLRPTPTAERLGLLQLGESADAPWPGELSDPAAGWSSLRWAQRITRDRLKPTAEVLAEADIESSPLVLSMRYGAGRSLYVATDEIWRWRYARGETLPERFWLQMIRLLGRESLARAGRSAVIELTPRRTDVDRPVRVAVELLDQLLVEMQLPTVQVRLTRRAAPGDAGAPPVAELTLRPERDDRRVYSAIWLPPEAGLWTAQTIDPALAGLSLSAEALVTLPDDELRTPETDHPLLARISEDTGGAVLPADDLGSLPDLIPNRKIRLLNERTESLWDTPLALILLLSLATMEWIGRRVIRLI